VKAFVTTDPAAPDPTVDTREAIAELARISIGEESLNSVFQRIVELAQRTIPRVAEASVTVIENDRPGTVASTGSLALYLDRIQYRRGYGPCLEAAGDSQLSEITDTREERRWPEYARAAADSGTLSSLSVPLPVQPLSAALNLYSAEPDAFGPAATTAAQTFASYGAVAASNMYVFATSRQLAENLDAAMRSRSVIEQAKGILMERHKITADEAFRILAASSMATNTKLRDLADALVRTGQLG
jgi:hypothetical protein